MESGNVLLSQVFPHVLNPPQIRYNKLRKLKKT